MLQAKKEAKLFGISLDVDLHKKQPDLKLHTLAQNANLGRNLEEWKQPPPATHCSRQFHRRLQQQSPHHLLPNPDTPAVSGAVETQLIAHDKEVYDIARGEARVFGSVSADGSVRIFDLRNKQYSMIIYESPQPDTPLLRLGWNKQDLRYMATILMDSNKVVVLDMRSSRVPVAELDRHGASVNAIAIAWAPQSCNLLCSAGDDGHALSWIG
ncbi:hypothetical protein V6N13_030653 [Hibiscus sabdariffa]